MASSNSSICTEVGIPLKRSDKHCVLVELPLPKNGEPLVPSSITGNVWDENHVKMPHSHQSTVKWSKVEEAYKNPIGSVAELEQAISSYTNERILNMESLEAYVDYNLTSNEREVFFGRVLPDIIELALSLPRLITMPMPLLQKETSRSISLSQKQISCLLANAFLCTFPDVRRGGEKCGMGSYPDINFNRLFSREEGVAIQKWKCLFTYFEGIMSEDQDGIVTFSRRFISERRTPHFLSSNRPLPELEINEKDSMMEAKDHWIVDFADQYIGGMVFVRGCVQEEILFLLYPELIVTRLFTEKLRDKEAITAHGIQRFNNGKGYARKFEWTGTYKDLTEKDAFRRRNNRIMAIDAKCFRSQSDNQYLSEKMERELLKAYAGFQPDCSVTGNLQPIATGNWGCGIFRGNPKLKSLLQLIAAGEAGRNVTYFAYGNIELAKELKKMYNFLRKKDINIGELTKILYSYNEHRNPHHKGNDLYLFLQKNFQNP